MLSGALCVAGAPNFVSIVRAQATGQATTQTTTQTSNQARYVTGEITNLDWSARRLSVKTDAGASITVAFSETTSFNRLPGGKTSPADAVPMKLEELAVGDRVVVDRGRVAAGVEVAAAAKVIVMSRADVEAKRTGEQLEWQQGVTGVVTALNPNTKEITVQQRGRAPLPGAQNNASPTILKVSDKTLLRRYAMGSVKFQDAKPSSFSDLKLGDQLRARGERAGETFTPKEIVSGSFRTILATVVATNPSANEIKVKPSTGNAAELIVSVQGDTKLRRVPPIAGAMFGGANGERPNGQNGQGAMNPNREARREARRNARDDNTEANQNQRSGGSRTAGNPTAGEGQQANNQNPMRGGGGAGRGNFDLQAMIEQMPKFEISELKPGDMVLFLSTETPEATKATAITMLAGVEPIVTAMTMMGAAQQRGSAGAGSVGLPAGLDLGIGGP